jgi:hypothetical protein
MARFKNYEEFKSDYEKYHYIDKVSNRYYPQKLLNEKQLQRYYLQYTKKWERVNEKNERKPLDKSEDLILYEKILERDKGCRLLSVLNTMEWRVWNEHQNGMGGILDGAHVFGKGNYPWMRYDEKNVVTINRFSHSCLDCNRSPIDGKPIIDDQRKLWWRRIVGDDWEYLNSLSRRHARN